MAARSDSTSARGKAGVHPPVRARHSIARAPLTALAAWPGGRSGGPSRRPVSAIAPDAAQSPDDPVFRAAESTVAPSHASMRAACQAAAPTPGTLTGIPDSGPGDFSRVISTSLPHPRP